MIRYLKTTFATTTLAAGLAFVSSPVLAGDLEWSGMYRIEGHTFHNLLLRTGEKKRKEYGVHQLILRPKIVAGDGLYINSQFNLATSGVDHGGNQLGVVFGNGLDNTVPDTPNTGNSGSLSENQEDEMFAVSQFYLTHVQEFGTFIAGRAPVQFGLGMTHNAGRGLFDHYMDTRDLVGYKIVMGNFYFLPMWAKVKEAGLAGYDDTSEWLLQAQYENPENDTEMGVMYWTRSSNPAGNDAGILAGNNPFTADTVTALDEYSYKLFNIYFARKFDSFNFGLEVANQSGTTGVQTAQGEIKYGGMGVALELGYKPQDKKWDTGLKAGWATGDDKDTTDEYEGFAFDRNYDVALMLFNHGLGQGDFLHSGIFGTSYAAGTNVGTPNDDPDVEGIGNVMYVSPYVNYKWSDRWSLRASVTTGWLDQTKLTAGGTDGDNGLGYEFDFSFNFAPNERVSWQNTFGWFEPGSAFELPGYGINSAYGFMSRAAISF